MSDKENSILPLKAAYAFGKEHGLGKEMSDIRDMEIEWDLSYTTTVRRGYIIELFQRQNLFEDFMSKDWPQGYTPWGKTYTRRCLRVRQRYEDFLSGRPSQEETIETDQLASSELSFEFESQLRDFIAGNLSLIQMPGTRLSLYKDSSGRDGVEYPTGVGPIDILATDGNGSFVVFELKRAASPDHAIGQLARYMGWVSQKMAAGKQVHGVIVAKSVNEKLRYAITVMPNVRLFEYDVSFKLRPAQAVE
jgi:hypothetical protein